MNKLIKNELFKILHKPSMYFFIVFTLIFLICFTIGNYIFTADSSYESAEKEMIEFYKTIQQVNINEKNCYADCQVQIEIGTLRLDYNQKSPETYFINTTIFPVLVDMYSAKYVSGDNEAYNNYKTIYDELLQKLNNYNWKEPIERDINNLKIQLESIAHIEDKTDAGKQKLKSLTEQLRVLEYRIDNNIPYSNYTNSSRDLNEYLELYETYGSINKNNMNDYLRYNVEKQLNILKYKIDNNIIQNTKAYNIETSVSEALISRVNKVDLFLVVACIFISCQVVSSEFEKGTIKKLLTKPFSRNKILTSKLIVAIIAFICYTIIYLLMVLIITGIAGGFSNLTIPQVDYNFNTNQAFEMNIFICMILHLLASLPIYLFTIIFTLCISIISTVTAFSMALGFVIQVFAYVTMNTYKKVLTFLPTNCWDLNPFLFGGISANPYLTLQQSISVLLVSTVILLFLSYNNFKNKEIKNQ